MRKISIAIMCILKIGTLSQAQSFYVNFGGTYNFANKSQILSDSYEMHYNGAFDYLNEEHRITRSSIGQGYMGSIAIGYNSKKVINYELNLSYLWGKSQPYTNTIYYSNGTETESNQVVARSILLTPFIIFEKELKNFSIYLSGGPTISFCSTKNVYDYSLNIQNNSTVKVNLESNYTSNPSIGVTSKIGIQKRINDFLCVFGDISFTYLNFSPDKRKVTKYTVNGVDSISTLNTSQLYSEYNDKYIKYFKYDNGQWVETWNENAPRKLKKYDIPSSFISINFGIRFYFYKTNKS